MIFDLRHKTAPGQSSQNNFSTSSDVVPTLPTSPFSLLLPSLYNWMNPESTATSSFILLFTKLKEETADLTFLCS